MAKRNIVDELVQGLEEIKGWQRGEVKLKSFAVELPKAADVPLIRKKLGYSQAALATLMGVSVATLRNWEQKRREPQGPARSLLMVAATHPEAVKDTMTKIAEAKTKYTMTKLAAAKKTKALIKGATLAKRAKLARLNKDA
jgi:putative transcriptional regulator